MLCRFRELSPERKFKMETSESRPIISMPFMQIKCIKCTERIPGFLVSIIGVIVSIWANCILTIACIQGHSFEFYDQAERSIFYSSLLTHLIVVLTCTAGLVLGLKEKNSSLLLPWIVVKGFEMVALLVGSIVLTTDRMIGLMPAGFIFLLIALYISVCVWDTYKKMDQRISSPEDPDLRSGCLPETLPKDPPSYDSFINQPRIHVSHN